jgi:hypothetical protein
MTTDTPAGRGRSPVLTAALTLVGVLLLYVAVPNIGPVVRAARADGLAGVFTAERLHCVRHPGHESCNWIGRFRSDDGTVRRTGVTFYGSTRDSHRAGEETRALDIGRSNRIYGPEGSSEWVFTMLMLLAGLGILSRLYTGPLRRLLSRRRVPEPMS